MEPCMEMSGSRSVPADVDTTWRALNDPAVLKASIPGCEGIERIADNEYRVVLTSRVGPVSARFTGRIVLSDAVPPRSYTLSFDGRGGAAGFAKGETRVTLTPDGAQTRIEYTANAQVGGKLAQIGSRLIDGAAAKVADDFFARFVEHVRSSSGAGPQVVPTTVAASRRVPWMGLILWVQLALAAAILIGMAAYWMTRPA
jgi:carbon monoxide dehydrogenase subunit G